MHALALDEPGQEEHLAHHASRAADAQMGPPQIHSHDYHRHHRQANDSDTLHVR